MKVLILGVNGFIGSHLVDRIMADTDWEVYGLDLGAHKVADHLANPRFHFVEGDVTISKEWIEYHIKKCDVVGTELCGALKNVLAIAAGLVDGLGLGYNARAALITRGLAEMARLVEVLGGQSSTVMGLAGMGDLLLTATGPQSRNRTFGELVGKGSSVDAARDALGGQVIEGMFTTEAALALAKEHGLDLPIASEVQRLLNGERPEEAVRRLMTRSLKSE